MRTKMEPNCGPVVVENVHSLVVKESSPASREKEPNGSIPKSDPDLVESGNKNDDNDDDKHLVNPNNNSFLSCDTTSDLRTVSMDEETDRSFCRENGEEDEDGNGDSKTALPTPYQASSSRKTSDDHSSEEEINVYFESFILGVAFLAVWTPQSLMAPNLTAMAEDFGFDNKQRDRLLGAFVSLATSVLSLPLSGAVGYAADVVPSRRNLYAATVAAGGLATAASGAARSYPQLLATRFVAGGCMAGCTPVAFSLLGDLFAVRERNAASSALTAMMGVGIIAGNLVAGILGPWKGWRLPFYVSAVFCAASAFACVALVREPVRGGKEEVLQDMIRRGRAYDKQLTLKGFADAMICNASNFIILLQGFFSNVPFGIIFIFLNDYLSQEQKLSVQTATYLVLIYGIGCAVGGILGGYWGGLSAAKSQAYLPIFMGATTLLGIVPYLGLLDIPLEGRGTGILAVTITYLSGMIESLPSVNVRPCLINVNPPELRGAALTTANLIINLARGVGPVIMTWSCSTFGINRQYSITYILIFFWAIAGIQLFLLAWTLPHDKEKMERELAQYADDLIGDKKSPKTKRRDEEMVLVDATLTSSSDEDDSSGSEDTPLLSIAERQMAFDAEALRQSMEFVWTSMSEMNIVSDDGAARYIKRPNRHRRTVSASAFQDGGNRGRTTLRRQTSLPSKQKSPMKRYRTARAAAWKDGQRKERSSNLTNDDYDSDDELPIPSPRKVRFGNDDDNVEYPQAAPPTERTSLL